MQLRRTNREPVPIKTRLPVLLKHTNIISTLNRNVFVERKPKIVYGSPSDIGRTELKLQRLSWN